MTRHIDDAPPLLTDADVLERVRELVGPACVHRQLWAMWVDGDGRQAPVMMPVEDLPSRPDERLLDGLCSVLGGLRDELRTDAGPGGVILTVERFGPDRVGTVDQLWAAALGDCCVHAGMQLRGTFLSTPGGVRPLPPLER